MGALVPVTSTWDGAREGSMTMEHRVEVTRAGGNLREVGIIVYQGREYVAEGTHITDTHALVYITSNARTGEVATWDGTVIGRYEETGKWKRRHPRSGMPWTIRTVRVRLTDGRTYVGRYGPDNSQAVRLRRVKGEVSK